MNTRFPLIGLLAVQIVIGYEWFMSGLTKLNVAFHLANGPAPG